MATKRITWPHEVVYTSQGQPAIYEELNTVLYVNGYITVLMEEVKEHMLQYLQELMEDAEAYG